MTYAVQPPVATAPPPAAAPRRPASVGIASVLLIVMAVAGLAYAVATLVTAPGTVDRFRAAAGAGDDVDGYVTVLWIGAALAAVLAVLLFALYVVLALGLRRGSNGFRIATLVVCALGLLAGCASATTMGVQRSGESVPGSLGAALSDAYPGSWIPLNVGLAIAQIGGYVLVGALLLAAPREFFGRPAKPLPPDPFAANSQLPPAGYAPPPAGYAQPGYYGPPQPVYGAPYPSAPPSAPMAPASAPPAAEHPGEPSPWAPPRPVTPTPPAPAASSAAEAPVPLPPPAAEAPAPLASPATEARVPLASRAAETPAPLASPAAEAPASTASPAVEGPAVGHRTPVEGHPEGAPAGDTDEGSSARPSS